MTTTPRPTPSHPDHHTTTNPIPPRPTKGMTTMSTRNPIKIMAMLAVAALAFAACSDDPAPIAAGAEGGESASATETPAETVAAPAAGPIAVTSATSSLGEILVGIDGLTVYGFTNDVDAQSACYGTCAEAWPPVIVGPDWDVAPDLDAGIFNAVQRDDGQLQLVAGRWPLYYFAGDAVPGDLNGQGSGEVWFAVATDGTLILDDAPAGDAAAAAADESDDSTGDDIYADGADAADEQPADEQGAPAPVSVGGTDLGQVLVDEAGLSLYGFLNDENGEPACFDACADAWPPVLVDSSELPAGLDPEVFSVVDRGDGTFQLRAGVWPLYRFAGDAAPGDVNGQNSGDVWFLVQPDGGLIRG